jgi:hypothetical protein
MLSPTTTPPRRLSQHGQPNAQGPVQNGAMLRLVHKETKAKLHSHKIKSHVTGQQEVSCFDGSDANDNWRVHYQPDGVFRLQHVETCVPNPLWHAVGSAECVTVTRSGSMLSRPRSGGFLHSHDPQYPEYATAYRTEDHAHMSTLHPSPSALTVFGSLSSVEQLGLPAGGGELCARELALRLWRASDASEQCEPGAQPMQQPQMQVMNVQVPRHGALTVHASPRHAGSVLTDDRCGRQTCTL